jgi:hypothetical protein
VSQVLLSKKVSNPSIARFSDRTTQNLARAHSSSSAAVGRSFARHVLDTVVTFLIL